MELHLKNKIIVVSGGASGFGATICETLRAEGAIPCIIDRREGNAFNVLAELTQPRACWQAIATITDKYGRIDGLINNAGIDDSIETGQDNYQDFLRSLQRNAFHYYLLTQAAVPWLRDTRGTIVNIMSRAALTGQGAPGSQGIHTAYAGANGIRAEFTRAWAVELQPQGIRVNGIVASTPATSSLGSVLTNPREIADIAAFLISRNSAAINGELVYTGGGTTHFDRQFPRPEIFSNAENSNERDHDHPFSINE